MVSDMAQGAKRRHLGLDGRDETAPSAWTRGRAARSSMPLVSKYSGAPLRREFVSPIPILYQ